MKAAKFLKFLTLLCFCLLFEAQPGLASESGMVLKSFEGDISELGSTRFLGGTTYNSCYSASCSGSAYLGSAGDQLYYYIDIAPRGKFSLAIQVGTPQKQFKMTMVTSVPVTIKTDIKVNPSTQWPSNILPSYYGSNWEGTMSIPSSTTSSRVAIYELENQSYSLSTRIGLQVTVTSSVEATVALAFGWIIIIVVVVVLILLIATCCIRRRMRKARSVAMQRRNVTQVETSVLSPITPTQQTFIQQQPQQNYPGSPSETQPSYPMYQQQPQYMMQPGQVQPQYMMQPCEVQPQGYPSYPMASYPQTHSPPMQVVIQAPANQ